MHRRIVHLLALAAALACLTGCCFFEKWRKGKEIEADEEMCLARSAKVPLAKVQGGGLERVERSTRIMIMPVGVFVDNTSLVAEWWRTDLSQREGGLDALDEEMIVSCSVPMAFLERWRFTEDCLPDGPDGFLVEPLGEKLRAAAAAEKDYCLISGRCDFEGIVTLYVHSGTPYDVLVRVLYTAGQAEYSGFRFVVKGEEGNGVIPVNLPTYAHPLPAAELEPQEECVGPMVTVMKSGVMVWALATRGGAGRTGILEILGTRSAGQALEDLLEGVGELDVEAAFEGELRVEEPADESEEPEEPTVPDWRGAVMLGKDEACPSVPRKGKEIDIEGLVGLLSSMNELADPCGTTVVTAETSITWHDLAPVLQTVIASGAPRIVLSAHLDDSGPLDCTGGVRPADVVP